MCVSGVVGKLLVSEFPGNVVVGSSDVLVTAVDVANIISVGASSCVAAIVVCFNGVLAVLNVFSRGVI